ncbi:MAG: DUF1540 domain-containing protein [Bacillota bacterium]|nr:DUF1540 domain-containing protein [Bacillota bacterium]
MTDVRCSVDSCHYWGEGEVCTADSIWVKNNMRGDADDERAIGRGGMEVGTIGERRAARRSARHSGETCCETMRPRGEAKY